MMIWVANGKQRLGTLIIDQAERLIVTLTLFVGNNADLVIQLFLRHRVEQKAHTVAFEEQSGFQRRCRDGLEIIGAV